MFSEPYKRYVLGILTSVYTLSVLDRNLMGLLLQPIKDDLHLSDTELGFLTGIAFALFYTICGLPIARWSDRSNRVTITSISIALWGVTVMSCLFVGNFTQLLAFRVAAAVGESGGMPPTYSLVGDYYPRPTERTRAIAIYMLAGPIAALLSFVAGGWLNEQYGWRTTFFLIGVGAPLLAVVVKMTVVEPRAYRGASDASSQLPPMLEVLRTLWRVRSSRHLILGIVLLHTIGAGLAPWYAAFMIRSHGMSTSELGLWLGPMVGISGAAGVLSGGYVIQRWFGDDERSQMRLSALMIALLVPCFALFLVLPQKNLALVALLPVMAGFNFFLGPSFAVMQRLVSAEMRATTLALVLLLANLIGMGLGPQIVGILSDVFKPAFGTESLRYAMLILSWVAPWSAWHFWLAARTVREDLSVVENGEQAFGDSIHRRFSVSVLSEQGD